MEYGMTFQSVIPFLPPDVLIVFRRLGSVPILFSLECLLQTSENRSKKVLLLNLGDEASDERTLGDRIAVASGIRDILVFPADVARPAGLRADFDSDH